MSHDLLNGFRRIECGQLKDLMRAARVSGVYALVDPREPAVVRYVGSSRHMVKRLADHAYSVSGKQDAERKTWVRELRKEGRTPVMVVLEELDAQKASFEMHYAERNWIERFRLIGQADLNRTLLCEEREFLLAQVKTLQAENAELRRLILQRATLSATLHPTLRCEDPESATQRNGGFRTRCGVAQDRGLNSAE